MPNEILEFLKEEQVGVLAVEMMDGSPHAATVHFAHTAHPLIFYFETYREYRKCEALFGREKSRASFVVGCNEDSKKTLQLDGVVELIKTEEKEKYDQVYFGKFPNKKEKSIDPKFVFFKFTTTWWKFTDFRAVGGKKILLSENLV